MASSIIPREDFRDWEVEGAVPKLWVQTSDGEALFKDAARNQYYPEIRNDWSEKIIYELSNRLALPAARYELAYFESSEGRMSILV